MDELFMNEDIKDAIAHAEDSLIEAKVLFANHLFKGAVNRCYFAYFWLVRGLLFQEDIFTKSHNGVQTKFSEHFIKTGKLPKKYNDYLSVLQASRGAVDYDLESEFSEEDVKRYLDWVEEFLSYVKDIH